MQTEDRRIRKSRKAIDDACWSLLREKDFAAMTIGEIAQRADINRATFYRHYADKYDWLERQIELLMSETFSFWDQLGNPQRLPPVDTGYDWIFRHYDEYFDIYAILFSEHTGLSFQSRITERLAEFLRERAGKNAPSADTEFEVQYTAASVVGMLKWWVVNDRPLPLERMAQRMVELHRSLPWQIG